MRAIIFIGRNPFENQVNSNSWLETDISVAPLWCRNPFENQVNSNPEQKRKNNVDRRNVVIPSKIRSIPTV